MAVPGDSCNNDLDQYDLDLPVDVPFESDDIDVSPYNKDKITVDTFEATQFEDVEFKSEFDDIDIKIEDIDISDEYNPNFTPYNLFNDKELNGLKTDVIDGITDEAAKNIISTHADLFDSMNDKLFARVEKLFADSNITGEDAAEIIGRGIPAILSGVNTLIDSMYLRETPADKIVKSVNANNAYKEGKILDANTKIAELESSDEVLLAKLQVIEANAIEAIAKAKLASFQSSDEMLELAYKAAYAEFMIKAAQAILAEYEASDVLLNIKLDKENYLTKQEEYKAYIEQFRSSEDTLDNEYLLQQYNKELAKANSESAKFTASEQMLDELYNEQRFKTSLAKNSVGASAFEIDPDYLGAKLNGAKAEAKVKQFEGSDDVLKLKKLLLDSGAQEADQKVLQIKSQIMLVLKQYDGFNLDAKVKLLGILFDGWSKGFMSGFEGVPAVISNDVMSQLFNNTGDVSNGFNGGDFSRGVYLGSASLTGSALVLTVGWDSGVVTGSSTLNVTPSWTEITDYPIGVSNSGVNSFNLTVPEDGQSHSVMIKVVTNYFDDPVSLVDANNSECCSSNCNTPFVKSSTFIYSIRQGATCPAGTTWDPETGACI